ncbi:NAD(P)H-dependent glycerol-3-phosphate dehydrogenase [Clostridium sardiniense]|uniref:Glycerol-3-phosphate dehydrogenase [NAD(P)+] n=1 Tax=Clostridium sardiniense TaxID=29369 RepID=A0ABS7KXI1_CLOSR|nr:NAD(P)H-dependent glycerol-3-phosphate dehydrogenase [Clostridium sardiniense]MBM7835100.1 glycerol-3-phosphate dehydrogenase (NAD(P)+) [Clostridium sardiniense]MBY0755510.1 NAD(P)H-dependent glycerol-3-phosphate dehydrogenase [Clostridium sardiniense]MDQ0460897.1 glycerol-3-phosphate dehydrogenase (NAD(P)+) [Clostridium sardiniense]
MSKVAFIGGGSFGTALAVQLGQKGNEISIFDRDINVCNDINNNRRNDKYIKDLIIPENITAYNNLDEAIEGVDYLVLAIPSHVIRDVTRSLKGKITKDVVIISIAKGIEPTSNKRLSEVIEEELPNPVVILSGPSHAEEVAIEIPTTLVATSNEMKYAEQVQELFMTPTLRIYTNEDIVGVEIGGAVKNIIALAAGIGDGVGYGDNSKAALMTRGMKEISRVGMALGGKAETFFGLTGMGDLIVTCTSMHSRNRRAGILIGKGASLDEALDEVGMIVEGVKACRAFHELNREIGVSMPITDALYSILFEGKDPREAVQELMLREKKNETH